MSLELPYVETNILSNRFPDLFANDDYHVHVDTPDRIITTPVVTFHGWCAALAPARFKIFINNVEQTIVDQFVRPDAALLVGEYYSSGWRFHCDVQQLMTQEQNAIVLDFRVEDRTVHRSLFRCQLASSEVKNHLIYFMHIPKTGGTSVRNLIERSGSVIKMMRVYDEPEFISNKLLSQISSKSIADFDIIFGHFKFGVHEYCPEPCSYMTLVRNPYDFIRSLYFFTAHVNRKRGMAAPGDIFGALNNTTSYIFDNQYTRYFAGVPSDRRVDAHDYALAISNIDTKFSFIGTTEYLQKSISSISLFIGVDLGIAHDNLTPNSREQNLVDDADLRRSSLTHIEYDLRLYEYVLRRFWGSGNHSFALS